MKHRYFLLILLLALVGLLSSCATVSHRMPGELAQMHRFLTQDNPDDCARYHYNFERHVPRLYDSGHEDSIFQTIDYIKTECGPAANLEETRLLLLSEGGRLGDSLIGSATVPQMLWYRSEQEYMFFWSDWPRLYGSGQPVDNTHDRFRQFETGLAGRIASNPEVSITEQTLGMFYSGDYDGAFARIQTDEFKGTPIRKSYEDYITRLKTKFTTRANFALLVGSWRPREGMGFLGNHPEIGVQLGGEGIHWRSDLIFSFRFTKAANKYDVDSMGTVVSTDEFSGLLFGLEVGYKLADNALFSTDVFVGGGYDALYSVEKDTDPKESVTHSSPAFSLGLRQRFFLDRKSGLYIGGIAKYNVVNYGNPHGTDLSGNSTTFSVVIGWSQNATLDHFLSKLNYKGSRRP